MIYNKNMKKYLTKISLSLIAVVVIFGLVGCEERNINEGDVIDEPEIESVFLDDVVESVGFEYRIKNVDTSDWKVHKNEILGFEVKLPKEWSCQDEDEFEKLGQRCEEIIDGDLEEGGSMTVFVLSDDKESGGTKTDFRENVRNKRDSDDENVYFIQIGQEDGFIEKLPGASMIVFEHGKDTWMITIRDGSRKSVDYVGGIIGSFRFN